MFPTLECKDTHSIANTMSGTPKKFLNNPEDAVREMMDGLLLRYPNKLRKLQSHNVLLSSNVRYDRVNVLSGGGSGHEPSHAGWIGTFGMLTGAIPGGIFASPAVSSILAAVRAVTRANGADDDKEDGGKGGCLLVVKNYTGDRLNFGVASKKATNEGRRCRVVMVADDCAVPRGKGVTGARGVAGTVFVHKIAGAAATSAEGGGNMDLDAVADIAERAARRVCSLGVALDAVTIPGALAANERLGPGEIEIGMGIHGEEGMTRSPLLSCDELAKQMLRTICDYGRLERREENDEETIVPAFSRGDDLAVLINNLGGTSEFEMHILARSVVSILESTEYGCRVSRLYVGTYMTSFDMRGASVSVLNLTGQDDLKEYLDAPTDALAWSGAVDVWSDSDDVRPSHVEVPEVPAPAEDASYDKVAVGIDNFSEAATNAIRAACSILLESEPLLTGHDLIVGDGDCGITMARGAREVMSGLDSWNVSHPVPLFRSIAGAISVSMGGTSGILLQLMFLEMSESLLSCSKVDAEAMAASFKAGVCAVMFYGGAKVGCRTMLDALVPASEVLQVGGGTLESAAKAARAGADGTADMAVASAGRSNYLSEDALRGTPDPGAVAVALVLEAMAKAL